MRHMELFNPYEFRIPIHIIGVGATGSFTACALSKMGIREINVYDFDIVEEHNFYNQLYTRDKVGKFKVDACAEMLDNIIPHNKRVCKDTVKRMSGIIIIMVDSMRVRKELFEGIKENPNLVMMLDARMGAKSFDLYEYHMMDINSKYAGTLYDDDAAETTACGEVLSIVGTAMNIASAVSWRIINLHNYTSLPCGVAFSMTHEKSLVIDNNVVIHSS